jgi:5-deoxy-D-glucuronate isomerase
MVWVSTDWFGELSGISLRSRVAPGWRVPSLKNGRLRNPLLDQTLGLATLTQRGKGPNTRWINNIAMEAEDYADSLLVTEVFTAAGNWSSYPSHRHDEDDFPRITYLEETYYHRLNPADGWAIQRVFTDDGSHDETMAVKDGEVVLVPRGHHPCGAPHGFELYYLNVMAGPRRAWRFEPAPEVRQVIEADRSRQSIRDAPCISSQPDVPNTTRPAGIV